MSKIETEELKEFMAEIEKESIIFISCVEPRSIKEIKQTWNYEGDSLYNKVDQLLKNKQITLTDTEPKYNFVEKYYLTNYDMLFFNLRNNSERMFRPFYNNCEELMEFYSGFKTVLNLEYIHKLFPNRKYAIEYYYAVMPQILCLLPVMIKLVQIENNIGAIQTLVLNIPKRFPSPIRNFIEGFLLIVVNDFKDKKIPDGLAGKLYKSIRYWLDELQIETYEKEILDKRFKAGKYSKLLKF